MSQTYYYGVRYAAGCSPDDLWVKYFTSSKHVTTYREKHGEPDIIQVRRTFETAQAARLWEEKVLKRIDAAGNPDFLNKANGRAIQNTPEHYVRIRELNSRPRTPEEKAKMSRAKKALIDSGKWQRANPALREDIKIKMSESAKKRAAREDRTGANHPNFRGVISTPMGKFFTLRAAAEIHGITVQAVSYRIASSSKKFREYKRDSI